MPNKSNRPATAIQGFRLTPARTGTLEVTDEAGRSVQYGWQLDSRGLSLWTDSTAVSLIPWARLLLEMDR